MWGAVGLVVAAQASPPLGLNLLPPIVYREEPQITAQMTGYVLREARLRGCPLPRDGRPLRVDVAMLIDPEGNVRTAIPRAIRCPIVEQYATGLAISFARNNLAPRAATSDQWYRASLVFDASR